MNNIKIYHTGNFNKRLCIVLHENGDKSLISYIDRDKLSTPSNVSTSCIFGLDVLGNMAEEIEHKYNTEIDEIKSKLKSTKAIDYPDDDFIKRTIKKVAKNIVEADIEFEDEKFENNLSEILQLRKQLYGNKNEGAIEARKHNRRIKYKIKELETAKGVELRYLDMDVIMGIIGK